MVVAVFREPVSGENFPGNREKNRENAVFGAYLPLESGFCPVLRHVYSGLRRFPVLWLSGNLVSLIWEMASLIARLSLLCREYLQWDEPEPLLTKPPHVPILFSKMK